MKAVPVKNACIDISPGYRTEWEVRRNLDLPPGYPPQSDSSWHRDRLRVLADG